MPTVPSPPPTPPCAVGAHANRTTNPSPSHEDLHIIRSLPSMEEGGGGPYTCLHHGITAPNTYPSILLPGNKKSYTRMKTDSHIALRPVSFTPLWGYILMADQPPRHMPPASLFRHPVAVGLCQQTPTKPTETRTARKSICPMSEIADSSGLSPRLFLLFPVHEHGHKKLFGEMAPMGEAARGVGPCGSSASAVELLDEYWCFRNVLSPEPVGTWVTGSREGGGGASCSDAEKEPGVVRNSTRGGAAVKLPGEEDAAVRRSLLRAPSLPPRVRREWPTQKGLCPHKSGGGGSKLRYSYSNLESVLPLLPSGRHHHLPPKYPASHVDALRHRSPSDGKVQSIIRYVNIHHRAITRESQQMKKWRSLGDLESEEVAGFRDLGFVFDKDVVNRGVVQVVPGLRGRRPAAENSGGELETDDVPRPYLSEARVVQRSAPPALDWVAGSSAADVKEQLRFWARVVASNVRQEC